MPKQFELPQLEGKWSMRMTLEMLVVLPQCHHNMELSKLPHVLACKPLLQLCNIQDALSCLAIAVEVGG